jgi:predicted DNA-binding helix-hairpin-helix protein
MTVEEIVSRATGEFGFTHCDQKRGLRYITEKLLNSMAGLFHHEKDHALLPVSDSIEMIVGDDRKSDEDFLKCYVIPNEPIEIEYVYEGHAERVEPLLVRLATSIGYEICRA